MSLQTRKKKGGRVTSVSREATKHSGRYFFALRLKQPVPEKAVLKQPVSQEPMKQDVLMQNDAKMKVEPAEPVPKKTVRPRHRRTVSVHSSASQGLHARLLRPNVSPDLDSSPSKSVASPIKQLPRSYKQEDSSQKWDLLLFQSQHQAPQSPINLLLQAQEQNRHGSRTLRDDHHPTPNNEAIQSTLRAIVQKQEQDLKVCSPLSNLVAEGESSPDGERSRSQKAGAAAETGAVEEHDKQMQVESEVK